MQDTTTPDDRRIDPDHIPDALKRWDRWVCWRYDGDRKPPYSPVTNRRRDPTDPDTWTDFDTAIDAYQNGNYDGIGFVLIEDDPFVGLDFDDCRDPMADDIHEDVAEVLDRFDSYSEISPSGTGIHTIVRGEKPDEYGCRGDGVEVYDSGQYLTVTGVHVEGTSRTIESRPDELARLCEEHLTEGSTAGDPVEDEKLGGRTAGGSDEAGNLPEYDEKLADVGEEVLRTLQREATSAFNSLSDLMCGKTGSYDDLLREDDEIDRSLQELMALTRLYETVVFLADEEGDRAKTITRSTFERYVRNHPITDDGQPRKWLNRDETYRKERLQRAICCCDRGKFNRFLNRGPRGQSKWQTWTGEYSWVTYSKIRLALHLRVGWLNDFFETIEDLCETVATFYQHDPNEEALRDLLDTHIPPTTVHGTTPNSGCVPPEDYPSPSEIAQTARQLDERDNKKGTYEEALRRLRREGMVKLARVGRQHVVYPSRLPDPPDACYVKCEGEKYEPHKLRHD